MNFTKSAIFSKYEYARCVSNTVMSPTIQSFAVVTISSEKQNDGLSRKKENDFFAFQKRSFDYDSQKMSKKHLRKGSENIRLIRGSPGLLIIFSLPLVSRFILGAGYSACYAGYKATYHFLSYSSFC